MPINWEKFAKKQKEIAQDLLKPDITADQRLALRREYSYLSKIFVAYERLTSIEKRILQAREQLIAEDMDQEMVHLFNQEISDLDRQYSKQQTVLDDLVVPPDEHDVRSIYLEIRAGTGGQEAALFASDLMKMYMGYAAQKNWTVTVESISETELKGIREVILHIKGKGVYGELKHESGVHRVQRVPRTEASGRIHTSTATVAVLPEAKDLDVSIAPSDLRIDVYRASGAGGQHVNTTDSAVRITHLPTGVVVTCQDERSQHKNKAKAMKILQSRILLAQREKQHKEMSKQRKEQIGSGMRSEKVRTYNFPQNRVTDHQVSLTLKKLDLVMQGELDEIIQSLRAKEREERQKRFAL